MPNLNQAMMGFMQGGGAGGMGGGPTQIIAGRSGGPSFRPPTQTIAGRAGGPSFSPPSGMFRGMGSPMTPSGMGGAGGMGARALGGQGMARTPGIGGGMGSGGVNTGSMGRPNITPIGMGRGVRRFPGRAY
jgi:hypothetical protein